MELKQEEKGESQIPCITISSEITDKLGESKEWKELTEKVREACETHGCFMVHYDKIPLELQEDLFKTNKEMFDLPIEKKLEYLKPTPKQGGYVVNNPYIPLYESVGVYGEDEVQAYQRLMWPEGKPGFCELLNSINAKMLELNLLVLRMLFESFELGEYYKAKALDQSIISKMRAMKYRIPKEEEDVVGLRTHVDRAAISVLCQNSVQGLEGLDRDGNWVSLRVPKGALVVIVGDALQVWSNGKLKPLKHRVVMSGKDDRYSCGFFCVPKDGVSIEVPQELAEKAGPPRYRPLVYSEYLAKHLTDVSLDALQVYAGI